MSPLDARARRGTSLLEVMIAITLLALVVSSLGALSIGVAHKSFTVSGSSYVNAEVTRQVDRLLSLPFDSLPIEVGSTAVAATPYAYTRTVNITDISAAEKQITLIVAPTNALFRAETVVVNRTIPASGSPLNSQ